MRILVIGPGALGIVAAVRLHEAGYKVEVAVRDRAKAELLNKRGFTMTDPDGSKHNASIPCVWEPKKKGPYNLIIHTTKCQVAETVLKKWLPTLASNGWLIPFQNGIIGDRLQEIVGQRRFMECSVYWPATLVEPGHSIHTGLGHNVIGAWPNGPVTDEHKRIAAILKSIAPTDASDKMEGVKWSKLSINAAMTSCGVVSGATLGEMIAHAPSRKAFLGIIREAVAVMKAAGIPVVRVGASKPDLIAKMPEWMAKKILGAAAKRYGNSRSSSAQSMARGEPTEVDYLNGLIVEAGGALGVPTPVNAATVRTVHALEKGEFSPGLDAVAVMMSNIGGPN